MEKVGALTQTSARILSEKLRLGYRWHASMFPEQRKYLHPTFPWFADNDADAVNSEVDADPAAGSHIPFPDTEDAWDEYDGEYVLAEEPTPDTVEPSVTRHTGPAPVKYERYPVIPDDGFEDYDETPYKYTKSMELNSDEYVRLAKTTAEQRDFDTLEWVSDVLDDMVGLDRKYLSAEVSRMKWRSRALAAGQALKERPLPTTELPKAEAPGKKRKIAAISENDDMEVDDGDTVAEAEKTSDTSDFSIDLGSFDEKSPRQSSTPAASQHMDVDGGDEPQCDHRPETIDLGTNDEKEKGTCNVEVQDEDDTSIIIYFDDDKDGGVPCVDPEPGA